MLLGDGALGGDWVTRVGSRDETSAFRQETSRQFVLPSCHVRTQQKDSRCEPSRHPVCQFVDLGLPSLQDCEKQLFASNSVCGICYSSQSRLRQRR